MDYSIIIKRLLLLPLLFLSVGCSSLMYFPSKEKFFDPAKVGPVPEDVYINSTDDVKIHAWYFKAVQENPKKPVPPKAILVFFHGNAQNITTHFATLNWILKEGYDYVIFDYRGYGESTGDPSPKGTVEDGKAVIRWVEKKHSQTPIVIFGQSLGGAISLKTVIELRGEIPFAAVVVDSTFLSYERVGADVLSRSWVTWIFQPLAYLLLSDSWAPGKDVAKISPIPLLIMHGRDDETVSLKLGKDIFDKAKEPKEFWEIPNGAHTDAFWRHDGKYRGDFLEYLDKVLSRKK